MYIMNAWKSKDIKRIELLWIFMQMFWVSASLLKWKTEWSLCTEWYFFISLIKHGSCEFLKFYAWYSYFISMYPVFLTLPSWYCMCHSYYDITHGTLFLWCEVYDQCESLFSHTDVRKIPLELSVLFDSRWTA